MHANDYQYLCKKTAIYPEARTKSNAKLYYLTMNLTNKTKKITNKINKSYHDGTINHLDLGKEVGDVCWFVAMLASTLGYDLRNIMEANLAKLNRRKEIGTLGGSGDNR